MSDILNRGNRLFEGSRIILPEHRKGLVELRRKKEEYQQPELDDQELERINQIIWEAYNEEKPVVITYATKYQPEKFCGFITKLNQYEGWIQLSNGSVKKKIEFNKLVQVEWP
ncbi:MAG: YolD-like family protein [Thermoactinomyces sp.]